MVLFNVEIVKVEPVSIKLIRRESEYQFITPKSEKASITAFSPWHTVILVEVILLSKTEI